MEHVDMTTALGFYGYQDRPYKNDTIAHDIQEAIVSITPEYVTLVCVQLKENMR